MLAALSGLVSLFDFIELLRRSATKPDADVRPGAADRGAAAAVHLHADHALRGAARRHRRVLAADPLVRADRRAGCRRVRLAVPGRTRWPARCCSAPARHCAGISPLSSVMLARAEALDNTYLRTSGGPLALAGGQLWLRQSDQELIPVGRRHPACRLGDRCGMALAGRQGASACSGSSAADRLLSARRGGGRHSRPRGAWVLHDARSMMPDHLPSAAGTHRPADRPHGRTACRRASPRPTRSAVWALPGLHRPARALGLLRHPPPPAFPERCWPAACWPGTHDASSRPGSPCARPGAAAWRR